MSYLPTPAQLTTEATTRAAADTTLQANIDALTLQTIYNHGAVSPTPIALDNTRNGIKITGTTGLATPVLELSSPAVGASQHWLSMVGTAVDYANSQIFLSQSGTSSLGPGSAGSMIEIEKIPAGAADGEGITIIFGTNSTGMGFEMSHSGAGQALLVSKSGASGHGIHCTMTGATNGIGGFFERTGGTAAPALEARQATANPAIVGHPTAVGGYSAQFNDDLVNNNTVARLVLITRNLTGGTGHCLELQRIPPGAVAVGSAEKIQTGANLSADAVDWDLAGTGRALRIHNGATELLTIGATGRVLLPDGTQALPAASFLNDTDCGIWRIGANDWGMGANNVLQIEVNGTGAGFFGATPVGRATGGENITNNVTSGGTTGTVADFAVASGTAAAGADTVDRTTVPDKAALDAILAVIRNDIFQITRALKQDHDQNRALGFLT